MLISFSTIYDPMVAVDCFVLGLNSFQQQYKFLPCIGHKPHFFVPIPSWYQHVKQLSFFVA
jgi:hypothetical protein